MVTSSLCSAATDDLKTIENTFRDEIAASHTPGATLTIVSGDRVL
jgi:hypothetical protein